MIFDTHAHYTDARFDEDREELLAGMKARGVGADVHYRKHRWKDVLYSGL